MSRFGIFSLVGAGGAVVQVLLFDALVRGLRVPAAAAAPIAVELALCHNFLWHERLTWRGAAAHQRFLRLVRFHAANGLVSIGGNTALTWLLVDYSHVPALPAAVASIAVCAPLNFLLADRWVYRAHRRA